MAEPPVPDAAVDRALTVLRHYGIPPAALAATDAPAAADGDRELVARILAGVPS